MPYHNIIYSENIIIIIIIIVIIIIIIIIINITALMQDLCNIFISQLLQHQFEGWIWTILSGSLFFYIMHPFTRSS